MCDYSLERVRSRPAKVGDRLVTTAFPGTLTRGFASAEDRSVAVCLLAGTEIAFDETATKTSFLFSQSLGQRLAIFRQINKNEPAMSHDALEFADGRVVFVTRLTSGQFATVLQLPRGVSAEPIEAPHNVLSAVGELT